MASNPLLSVVIQSYNYGHYLPQAIDSILNQDFPLNEIELIIIDDASKDNSPEIIQDYAKRLDYIRPVFYKENKGTHYSANHSMDLARGEYIHWLAADDFRDKTFLKKSMDVLLKNPQIGMCCSDFGYTDEKLGRFNLLSNSLLNGVSSPLILNPEQLINLLKKTSFWIPGHTVVVKRELAIKYNRFNKKLREKCDWFLFHHIALFEGVAYIPEVLAYWYCHGSSYSAQSFRSRTSRTAVATELLSLLDEKTHKESRRRFYKAAILGWACKQVPLRFMKPSRWIAFLYLVKRRTFRIFLKLARIEGK